MKTILSVAALTLAFGPVLLNGQTTYTPPSLSDGQSVTVSASQGTVPSGTYFIAGGSPQCIRTLQIVGGGQPGAPPFSGYITSSGKFTFYHLGNTAGCVVTITSSAGGDAATIAF
ncbi:MAG TPA: hypothetical protein VGG22_07375 [Candidatus Baltobacteraceae bacterium]|jgi:hypothetical protein